MKAPRNLLPALFCLSLLAGCDRLDMYDQPRYEPLEGSELFEDGLASRPPVEGTVARGRLEDDPAFFHGRVDGRSVAEIPERAYRERHADEPARFPRPFEETPAAELRRALLERGRERFDIHCSVCHGRTGDGRGMVVRRGFRQPPSYHIDRLREAPAGHLFEVITHGFGAMARYAPRIEPADRWAIVAYVRALQLSQHAELGDVPSAERERLETARVEGTGPPDGRSP
jgi:mono/diheme cytochrome c family protein